MRELNPHSATPPLQPIALRSMFWRPEYLVASDWLEHLPAAFWLVEALQPRVLVEVAAPAGPSYFAFCQAVDRLGLDTRCFAVPAPEADGGAAAAPAAVDAFHDHNDPRYAGFSRLLEGEPDEVLARFGDGSVDLLHIDLRTGYGAMVELLSHWRPKLSPGAVLVLHRIHDRGRRSGAHRLLADLAADHPVFEFTQGEGLAIVGLGGDHGGMLDRLFSAAHDDMARRSVHEVFSRLGRACVDGFHAQTSQQRARSLLRDLEDRQRQLDEAARALEQSLGNLRAREDELTQARLGLQLQGERQAMERAGHDARLQLLQEARDDLRQQLQQAQARAEAVASERGDALRQLASENAGLRDRLEAVTREREEAARRAEAAEQRRAALAERCSELEGTLAAAAPAPLAGEEGPAPGEAADGGLQDALAESRRQTARLAELIGERDAELAGLQAATEAQRRRADAAVAAAQAELATLRGQHAAAEAELATLRGQHAAAEAELATLREAGGDRDGELAAVRAELATHVAIADDRQRELGEWQQRADELAAQLAARDSETAALAGELAAARREHAAELARLRGEGQAMIQKLAATVKDLRDAQAAHAAERDGREATVAGLQRALQSASAELAAATAAHEAQRRELEERLAAVSGERDRRGAETATLTRMLMDTEHRAHQLQASSLAADGARRHAEGEAAALRDAVQERDERIERLEDELAHLRGELITVRSSGSWRLTAPLRAMVRPFRPGSAEAEAAGVIVPGGDYGATAAMAADALSGGDGAEAVAQAGGEPAADPGAMPAAADPATGADEGDPDDLAELRACELFDPAWYLATYPDVAASGADPAVHYLRTGAAAGRDPGPGFATAVYLLAHPDAAGSGMNPLLHWARIGRHQGYPPR